MRYGIFSDVHSNLEAFTQVLKFYKKHQIDKFIFLGDIIGYGADPSKVITLLKELNPITVAGNHDWTVANKFDIEYFNRCAKDALIWTAKKLTPKDMNYLGGFGLVHEEDDFICVHGSPYQPEKFNYIFDSNDARFNFDFFTKKICFVGHSHVCEVYLQKENNVVRVKTDKIKIVQGERYIINVGSVGQPRDRDWRACFCIYDSDKEIVIFKRLEYNVETAAKKILSAGLPAILGQRLYAGY